MAIYVVRIATRTVNGDGCHEAVGLKRVYHINSTDRMHHQILLANVIETRFLAENLVEGVFEGVVDSDPNSNKDSIVKKSKQKALGVTEQLFPKGE